jgi:hypothetical protein
MRARVTPDDLAAGQLVDPDWYPCEITNYKEEPAGTDGSTNALITFKILGGTAKGDKFKGARCRKLYNEKAMGFAAPLLVALGAKVDKDTGIDADLSEGTLLGRKVDVHIRRGETNKKNPFNDPVEFAPIGQITKWKEPVEAK